MPQLYHKISEHSIYI